MKNLIQLERKNFFFCCDTHFDFFKSSIFGLKLTLSEKDVALYLTSYFQNFLGNQDCISNIVAQELHMYAKFNLKNSQAYQYNVWNSEHCID